MAASPANSGKVCSHADTRLAHLRIHRLAVIARQLESNRLDHPSSSCPDHREERLCMKWRHCAFYLCSTRLDAVRFNQGIIRTAGDNPHVGEFPDATCERTSLRVNSTNRVL